MANVLPPDQLAALLAAAEEEMAQTAEADALHGDGAGAKGHRRYMFGFHRSIGTCMHRPEWAQLAAQPTADRILSAIWQSESFCCSNGVGDFSFPGSEYQVLHLDVSPATKIETDAATGQVTNILPVDGPEASSGKSYRRTAGFHDPAGKLGLADLACFEIAVNYALVDFTRTNAPLRIIPGTHTSSAQTPSLEDE